MKQLCDAVRHQLATWVKYFAQMWHRAPRAPRQTPLDAYAQGDISRAELIALTKKQSNKAK